MSIESFITFQNDEEMQTANTVPVGTVGKLDDKIFIMSNDSSWKPVSTKVTEDGLHLNVYELNREIISQIGPLSDEKLAEGRKTIEDWYANEKSDCYLLYGKESSYFTIFQMNKMEYEECDTFINEIFNCLNNIGEVYSIEQIEKSIEIWVKWISNDTLTCLYLFDFSKGIIHVNP